MTLNSGAVAPSPASSTSSSTACAGSSVVANASRLRENQRRSRARKKEYLLSLESRLQTCQRNGIEANIEIQTAAKKVVRENQLLRVMLNRRGMTDVEINKTLKEGGEGTTEGGETAVEGVLKVIGKRPCGGEPITGGGAPMQCKPTRFCEGQRIASERRNSTGMVAAREAERGGGRGAVNGGAVDGGAPALTVATSKHSSQPSSSPHLTHRNKPPNYPTPTSTPTVTSVSSYAIPTPAAVRMNNYYSYNSMSSPQPQPQLSQSQSQSQSQPSPSSHTGASQEISSSLQSYDPYQLSCTIPAQSNNSCCAQPHTQFYPATQSQCSPCSPSSMVVSPTSSPCCPPQRPIYVSSPSSYQTAPPISSSNPCHIAQSYINQLHSELPGEHDSNLIDEICSPSIMENGHCHVDNAILFGVLDRI